VAAPPVGITAHAIESASPLVPRVVALTASSTRPRPGNSSPRSAPGSACRSSASTSCSAAAGRRLSSRHEDLVRPAHEEAVAALLATVAPLPRECRLIVSRAMSASCLIFRVESHVVFVGACAIPQAVVTALDQLLENAMPRLLRSYPPGIVCRGLG
jgi:hypothetical protein